MPALLYNPNRGPVNTEPLETANYRYRYPLGLNLKPGSELHDRLRDAVMSRATASASMMSNRHASWRKIDQILTSYIPLDDLETKMQEEDDRRPVSIVVPVSQAVLETLMTYLVTAFLDDPVFRYEGNGPEDMFGAMLMEKIVSVQARRAKMGVQLHTMFRDSLAYGMGMVTPVWTETFGMPSVGGTPDILYEGNELWNIDPYRYLPDTNVAVQDVQRGERTGWVTKTNRLNLLSGEAMQGSSMFNCKYLAHITGESLLGQDNSNRDRDQVSSGVGADIENAVDVVYMYINLVPSEWGIGRVDRPEKWVFGLAGDKVLIMASPINLKHNRFPLAVCSPDFDGYSVTPVSKIESIYGLQTLINFLYNSHIANVRKAINDMLIIDPLLINTQDIFSPGPGKVIRLRRSAWGRGVDNAVKQLAISDVTRGHLPDAANIMGIVESSSGAVDSLKGIIQGGERRSATEFEGTRQGALSRLERAARISSLQAMVDLAYMIAEQTKQMMSKDEYIKTAGESENELRAIFGDDERLLVGPGDIDVAYDVVIPDGTLPTSGNPQMWLQMIQMIGSNETLMQNFDMVRMFQYWAKMAGAKNVGSFVNRANVKVVPDEEALAGAEAGNLISMEGASEAMA